MASIEPDEWVSALLDNQHIPSSSLGEGSKMARMAITFSREFCVMKHRALAL